MLISFNIIHLYILQHLLLHTYSCTSLGELKVGGKTQNHFLNEPLHLLGGVRMSKVINRKQS